MASDKYNKALMPRRGKYSDMYSEEGTLKDLILGKGEIFIEYPDGGVGSGPSKVKIGDGVTVYKNLPYAINPQDNVIEGIQVNNSDLSVSDKKVNITIPENVGDLSNDVGYLTREDETVYSLSVRPAPANNGEATLTLSTDEDAIASEISIIGVGGTEVTSDQDGNLSISSPGVFTNSTEESEGKDGLVPKAPVGAENLFLRGDGQWIDLYSVINQDQYDFGEEDNKVLILTYEYGDEEVDTQSSDTEDVDHGYEG